MPATPPTYQILEPFGADAGGSFITLPVPAASQIGILAGAASFADGFPPATMTEEVAGGVPPYGQDMNGILYMLSAVAAFQNAGNLFPFDSVVAGSPLVNGYAEGAILAMANGTGLWISTVDNNTANPDTVGSDWATAIGYGIGAITATGTGHTMSPTDRGRPIIVVQGALTSNFQLVFPDGLVGEWLIVNLCTGSFPVQVRTTTGANLVTIPAGGYGSPTPVYSNGTSGMFPATTPLTIPIDQAATPSTIAERNSTGQLLATFFNSSNIVETPSIGSVVVQNTAADGYLRKISAANFISQLGIAKLASPALTGTPTAPTAAPGANSLQIATTAFVAALGALKANAANAALTGVPTAPTAAAATSDTQLATTAFVNTNAGLLTPGANGSFRIGQFLVNWGTHTSAGTGAEAVSFTTNFATTCAGVFCQSSGAQHTTNATSITTTGFNLTAGVAAQPTLWFAIGY